MQFTDTNILCLTQKVAIIFRKNCHSLCRTISLKMRPILALFVMISYNIFVYEFASMFLKFRTSTKAFNIACNKEPTKTHQILNFEWKHSYTQCAKFLNFVAPVKIWPFLKSTCIESCNPISSERRNSYENQKKHKNFELEVPGCFILLVSMLLHQNSRFPVFS